MDCKLSILFFMLIDWRREWILIDRYIMDPKQIGRQSSKIDEQAHHWLHFSLSCADQDPFSNRCSKHTNKSRMYIKHTNSYVNMTKHRNETNFNARHWRPNTTCGSRECWHLPSVMMTDDRWRHDGSDFWYDVRIQKRSIFCVNNLICGNSYY